MKLIWQIDDRHELAKVSSYAWGKTWAVIKTDEKDFIDQTWTFPTKREAIKFINKELKK